MACDTCPFKTSTPLTGCPTWVEDVAYVGDIEKKHTCHQTDKNADGFKKGTGPRRPCAGIRQLGKPGFYKSKQDLVMAYVLHWKKTGFLEEKHFPQR